MLRNAREMHLIEFKNFFQNWFDEYIGYKDRSKLSRSKNVFLLIRKRKIKLRLIWAILTIVF